MKWVLRGLAGARRAAGGRLPDLPHARYRCGGNARQIWRAAFAIRRHRRRRDRAPARRRAEDAPAIILLHGSNADLHTWEPWVEALKGQDYRVIRFDQVGHGLTGPDPERRLQPRNYVADIVEVADALGLEQFILGGNSMGGKHALAFAVAHPDRVPAWCWSMAAAGRCEAGARGGRGRAISASPSRGCRGQPAGRTDHAAPLIAQSLRKASRIGGRDPRRWTATGNCCAIPATAARRLTRFSQPYDR